MKVKQIKIEALESVPQPLSNTNQSIQPSSVLMEVIKKMTDSNTLADYNIKDFGKLSSNQVSCYPTRIDSDESIAFCSDKVCLECGNNHSFRGNFEDAITFIDLLPELFPEIFKENRNGGISATKLQEFVN